MLKDAMYDFQNQGNFVREVCRRTSRVPVRASHWKMILNG